MNRSVIKQLIVPVLIVIFIAVVFHVQQNGISSMKQLFQGKVSEKPGREINVTYDIWIPYWDQEKVLDSLEYSKNKLSTVLPVWYKIDPEGSLLKIEPVEDRNIRNLLLGTGVKLIPTIQNDFDPVRVSEFLKNEEKMDTFINELVSLATEEAYDGWDINFEQVYEEDRELFVQFIKKTSGRFKEEGLILSVTVHAQTGTAADWSGAKGHDWEGIGNTVDVVRIMVYDFHNKGSVAGPITPVDNLRDVLSYANKVLPREKVVVGLPLYGYDWVGNTGVSIDFEKASEIADEYKVQPIRDRKSGELNFNYTQNDQKHTVWYQDAVSVAEKMKVAKEYGYNRFTFWRLGGEDKDIWKKL